MKTYFFVTSSSPVTQSTTLPPYFSAMSGDSGVQAAACTDLIWNF